MGLLDFLFGGSEFETDVDIRAVFEQPDPPQYSGGARVNEAAGFSKEQFARDVEDARK